MEAKLSQTTATSDELSDAKVHTLINIANITPTSQHSEIIQPVILSSLPSMLLALSRLSSASFSLKLSWNKFTERDTATVPLSAPPPCSWELTLLPETVNPLHFNRFPFDPGGCFSWLHLIVRA